MDENCPNVLIVQDNEETPEEIVSDYVQIIQYNLDHGIPLEEVLYMFFNDVNLWTCKQFYIDVAKQSLQQLENIHSLETEFIEDDGDFN